MMRSFPLPSRLARTGCSVLALATVFVVGPSPAAAQSFLGTGTATNGAATTITTGPGTTTISVTAPQTVINWVPTDNATNNNVPIVFQSSGTTASFLGTGNYAVLNNIAATDLSRVISMNGTITAGALSNAAANGSIYFYSPSGILLGGTSMINVGSLVMSASPIVVDGGGNFINGAATVIFGQALRSTAAVTTTAGSAINATAGDAYVAMVAPRVQHGGTINVNGSAALVGAEAATINFSPDGLFDIQVTAGTTDVNGVYNSGNIIGSASTGPTDVHRAYLVAVPKNSALTMLITTGSDLGFNVAGAANVVGNTVVLSAGHDIANGSIDGVSPGSGAGAIANLEVRDSNFTSALIGEATGFAHFFAFSALNFSSDVATHADGDIWFSTQTAVGTIDVDGNLSLSTERHGANGQAVTASLIDVYNLNGAGRITVDGLTTLDTDAYGGDSSVSGTNGGNAVGGAIDVVANGGGTIELLGGFIASADGHGGTALVAGADGGTGTGGDISLRTGSTNGIVRVAGFTDLSSTGRGGNGSGGACLTCDGDGGAGQGGEIRIYTGDGTGSSMAITGAVNATAGGFGGSASSSTSAIAGAGMGGVAAYYVGTAGVMTLTGNLSLQADGHGGDHSAANAGSGYGGLAVVSETIAATSGTMTITGNVELSGDGTGGASFGIGALGGDGYGGAGLDDGVGIVAEFASTTINGTVNAHSTGTGGDAVNGTGGTGHGGEARIRSENLLRITGNLTATAEATGGQGATGGQADGGEILIRALAGGDLQLLGATNLVSTNATGGQGANGNGGNAVGGDVTRIYADGVASTVTISGATTVTSNATGGSSQSGAGGTAGGGVTAVSTAGGTIVFGDDVLLSASATGGNSAGGNGGNSLGGNTRMSADNGTISVAGDLTLNGSATGGTGASGGNATALVPPLNNQAAPVAVSLYADNGGSISVDGQATLNGSAVGGAGASGNGGNAAAGEADVVPFVGDISLGSLSINVIARGGNGGNGGSGGFGQGGSVDVAFGFDADPISGTITLGSAAIMADGYGGNGGAGINANFGGDGGVGGAGLGGTISFVGSAAGGTLDSGPAVLTAIGTGGLGGAGGNGGLGIGGDGGAGGNGTGGFIQTGTISQNESPGSGGGAAYSTLSIDTSASGGTGGNGGSGGGGNGAGGDGGNATGGRSEFLIRGVLGTADSVTLMANATGGNGGSGMTAGDGGDARTGTIAVESKDRFAVPTERGTLIVGSIVGSATATGGSGATAGTSTVVDGSYFRVLNGDATIGSVAITLSGDLIDSTLGPSFVSVRDGAATIGTFSFVTDGTLSLDADNGAMNAGSIALNAANFVPHTANPVPTNPGTYFANSFAIQTGNNFVTTANLDSVATLTIVAPGAIQIGNVTGDNSIVLNALGAEVDIGNVLAGGVIDIHAQDFIFTGNIVGNGVIDFDAGSSIDTGSILNTGNTSLNAGTSITVGAINSGLGSVSLVTDNSGDISGSSVVGGSIYADSDGDIFLGNLTAPGDIELVAIGDMLIGNALAGETIDLDAGGYIDGGSMTAGDSVYAEAGDYVDLLDVSAGIVDQSSGYDADYNVGILAGTTIDTGDIAAFNSIGLGAAGNIYTGSIDAGNIFLALSGGNMSFGTINAGQQTYLADDSMIALGGDPTEGDFDPAPITILTPTPSGGSITLRGPVTTGRFVAAAATTLTGSTIDSGSSIYTFSGGNMTLTDLDAGSSIFQRAGGIIAENDLDAGSYIDIRSTGGLALGDLVAGDYIDLRSNAAIGLGNATSGETINFLTGSTVTGGAMTAGDSVLAEATGAIQLGAITAGITDPSTSPSAEYVARFSSSGAITTGNVNAAGRIGFATPTNLLTGNLSTGEGLSALVGGNITAGAINASDYVYLANYSMAALGGTFADFDPAPILALAPVATGGSITLGAVSTGRFEAAAGTTLTGTTINSDGLLYATSGGTMTLGNLVAGNDVRLTSGGNIVTGSIYSYDDVALVATGSILTLDIFAYDDVSADAGTTISTDDITGNSIELFADGDITTGDLLTRDFFSEAAAHALIPGTSITVESGGDVDVGTIDALDGVHVSADGTIDAGTIDAETFVELFAGGNITAGTINAGSYIDIFSDTGLLDLDDLHAGTEIDLESDGSLQFGDATADDFNFEMGGSVDGGNITAIAHADGHADGAIVLENITVTGPPTHDDDFSIGFTSATSIEVENVDGFDRVGFATLGDLNTGTISAGSLVVTLVGGDTVTGSITTDANGRVYMADASMCQGACGDDDSDVEIESIIALAPVPTGGSINVNGAITTGSFQAAAGDNLVTRAITANSIDASAGETAAIDGIWSAASVSLASGDINITANGRIDAGTSGSILLNAVGTDGPALIGDGLTGNGYALSNAEFGRLSGGEITIAVGGSGGDADTMIGDLTITGPLAGSNIESSDGGVHFITLGESGDELDGTLRVVGDVVATGFGADNYLSFYTQNFELDAATGSIAITSSGNALAGILELYASRIHIAEGTLLDQLAANPQFAGYREALNQQAAVQRPEGVIRAANFDIEFGGSDNSGPYTLYVQNMGTTTVPAGFLLNAANIGDDGEGTLAPGSVDMAINGQIITASGTLTGTAVRDLLVAEFGTTAFAAGSTINGCVLVGPCGVAPARPQIVTPTSTDVPLSDDGGLGDGSFGNEGDIDDGESGDGDVRSSPISPPNPLFDSRPLVQSGDIDDPVSGAGNPSLYGTPDDDTQECDRDKDNICKVGKQGDGK